MLSYYFLKTSQPKSPESTEAFSGKLKYIFLVEPAHDVKLKVDSVNKILSYSKAVKELLDQITQKSNVTIVCTNEEQDPSLKSAYCIVKENKIGIDSGVDSLLLLHHIIFELCNLANSDLDNINYYNFANASEYALYIEKAEFNTTNKANMIMAECLESNEYQAQFLNRDNPAAIATYQNLLKILKTPKVFDDKYIEVSKQSGHMQRIEEKWTLWNNSLSTQIGRTIRSVPGVRKYLGA